MRGRCLTIIVIVVPYFIGMYGHRLTIIVIVVSLSYGMCECMFVSLCVCVLRGCLFVCMCRRVWLCVGMHVRICVCSFVCEIVFMCVCMHADSQMRRFADSPTEHSCLQCTSIGWHYLSNATCWIRPHLFYACLVVSRITIICYILIRRFWRRSARDKQS